MTATIDTTAGAGIAGNSGNNVLYGTGGDNTYYGGTGNDAFVISAAAMAASTDSSYNGTIKADAAILDFSGAGGWSATNNDFLALTGFGAGSTLTFDHYGTAGDTTQFYTIHDTTTNANYEIYIHSLDGALLTTKPGDYAFYA